MKFNFLHLIYVLLLMGTLLGCSSKVDDVNDDMGNATYEFGKIEKVTSEALSTKSNRPDIKDTFTLDLRACFKDKIYIQDIIGEEFEITSNTTSIKKQTNANGCLSWREEFKFDYLRDETYFKISGNIRGKTNFKGITEYQLAVNPWTGEMVDLRFGSVSKIANIEGDTKSFGRENSIELEQASISFLEKQFFDNKTILKMEFMATPQVLRRTIDGAMRKQALTGGEFAIRFHLISKNLNNDERRILTTFSSKELIRRDGILKSLVEFDLNQGVDPNSIIELGFEIKDISDVNSLGSDFGVMSINQIEGRFNSEIINLNIPFSTMSNNQKNLEEISPESFGFILDQIIVQNGSEGGANNTIDGHNRSVDGIFTIKIVDSLIRNKIKNYPFKIDVIDMKKNQIISSEVRNSLHENGDVVFRAPFEYQAYAKNSYRPYLIRVSSTSAPFNDVTRERIIHCNPALKSGDFCIDSKFGEPPVVTTENIPQIDIKSFSYHFIDNALESFKLNKSLDLVLNKVLRLEMQPKMRLEHDYDGNPNYMAILNGRYKLRFLILAPKDNANIDYTREISLQDYYTLTGSEKEVVVEDGFINTKVELPMLFTDHIFYSLKNIALIELSAVDVETDLKPGYFVGTINGSKKGDTIASTIETGKRLSSGDIDIAKSLIDRLEEVKHKLQKDETIGDNYLSFINEIKKVNEKVPVFDVASLKIKQRPVQMQVNTTETDFIRRNGLKMSESEITEFITRPTNMSSRVASALCHAVYNKFEEYTQMIMPTGSYMGGVSMPQYFKTKGERYKKCIENPKNYLNVKPLSHVYQIVEQPDNIQVEPFELSKSVAFFMSRGQVFSDMEGIRKTDYTDAHASISAGLEGSKFGLFGGLSFSGTKGRRTDIYTVNQDAELLSNQKRNINQVGVRFDGDRFDLDFKARVKSCVLVAGKMFQDVLPDYRIETNFLVNLFKDKKQPVAQTSEKRFYICMKDHRVIKANESFYFIKLAKNSTMSSDSLSRNTSVNVIRGEENFEMFRQGQIEADQEIVLVEKEDDEVGKRYKNYLDNKGKGLTYKDRIGVGFPSLLE